MIYEVLDIEPRQRDLQGATELKAGPGEIRFDNIYFSYNQTAPVLHGVTFMAKAGETTAVVGASGAGKSTLISLVQRFYDLDRGRILFDGQDIAGVTKQSLRHAIAYVSQQPYLFEGTIADNIRYGRPDASDEEIIEAAKLAHAHEFILQQPQGYDTPVGENGVTLSGGQRQRISIARAIVRNTPVLLLDEATSALDNRSEKRVQQALETIMQNRTTIVIAHRLSTVVNADRIVVMEAGRVVEEGRHEDLIDIENGVYARFYQLQRGKDDIITEQSEEALHTGGQMSEEVQGGNSEMGLVVVGAGGRMGQTLIRTIQSIEGAKLVGAIERSGSPFRQGCWRSDRHRHAWRGDYRRSAASLRQGARCP